MKIRETRQKRYNRTAAEGAYMSLYLKEQRAQNKKNLQKVEDEACDYVRTELKKAIKRYEPSRSDELIIILEDDIFTRVRNASGILRTSIDTLQHHGVKTETDIWILFEKYIQKKVNDMTDPNKFY